MASIAALTSKPHVARVWVEGDEHGDAIAELREQSIDAVKRDDYETAARIGREIAALKALPHKPAHWELRETGESEAAYFARLTRDEQRAYLTEWTVLVYTTGGGRKIAGQDKGPLEVEVITTPPFADQVETKTEA
jgi:hypothetical protein